MPTPRIDLSVDSKATQDARRGAENLGVVLGIGAGLAFALQVPGVVGDRDPISWIVAVLTLFPLLYVTLAVYIADVPNGNRSAIWGMTVGGIVGALWTGWDWMALPFGPWLGLFATLMGLLAGTLFGAIGGVYLGWLRRCAAAALTKRQEPIRQAAEGALRDPWLDGP